MLEVRWRYRIQDTGEPTYIWAEGEVVQVSRSPFATTAHIMTQTRPWQCMQVSHTRTHTCR